MQISINGSEKEVPDATETVAGLLEHLGLGGYPVLVELNGAALLKREFPESPVADGDRIEIIKMVAGG